MLTPSELQRYRDDGFLLFEALIRGERLQHYLHLFDGIVEASRQHPTGGGWTYELDPEGRERTDQLLHKIHGVCVVEPRVLELVREPVIVARVADLIGPSLDVFGTKFFPMLPHGGTSTRWHQDNFYFDCASEDIVTCGIYLQDADRENGCLKVIPGSHRAGACEHRRDPGTHGSWVDADESRAIHLEIPGGSVVLFSANLLHGANANVSSRSRYSTAWHYIPGNMELEHFRKGVYEDRHIVCEGTMPVY